MWPFKRKPESPQEVAAETRLDEVTREVAWEEFHKEEGREQSGFFGPLMRPTKHPEPLHDVPGDPVPEPVDDPDPGDERGLRDVRREDDPAS